MTEQLGAVWNGEATSFAVFSRHATAVSVCFFERPESSVQTRSVRLRRGDDDVWRAILPDAPPGTLYGLRARGPWRPWAGHLFNPSKLLVDPMARAVAGETREASATYGFDLARPREPLSYDSSDSAAFMPKCVVVDPAFDWQDDRPPETPWSETVIYEAHVRGLTQLHPDVPEKLRGTYLGLCCEPVIEHLLSLGVTAVELLPVMQIADEPHLAAKKLSNYWGYSPLAFCAPHGGYATNWDGRQVDEFKTMVRTLHRAGLEVLLDVVYNHTAEGGVGGPTYSLRGLDHRTYHRLHPRNGARHLDVTGCGNTLDVGEPAVRRLILESLRYWVHEMHVDGFRFDLGPTLGREHGPYDRDSLLFREIAADPDLSRVKLIAEPWDVGLGGYQLGNFPPGWAEWNDRCRDAFRRFWHASPDVWAIGSAADLAWHLSGSADLFDEPDRGPLSGVSFVACHDGFTLHDAVSYDQKHNESNREGNRDGHDHNLSCNWGVEGPSDDDRVRANRAQAKRNLIATVALSQGVPMLLHGDEIGRTQHGNNNAYCQDNETSWVHWNLDDDAVAMLDFVRRAFAARRDLPQMRRESFQDLDLRTFDASGAAIEQDAWATIRAFTLRVDAELLLLINGSFERVEFRPPDGSARRTVVLETADPHREGIALQAPWPVEPFSITVLQTALDRGP